MSISAMGLALLPVCVDLGELGSRFDLLSQLTRSCQDLYFHHTTDGLGSH